MLRYIQRFNSFLSRVLSEVMILLIKVSGWAGEMSTALGALLQLSKGIDIDP